MFKKNTLQLLLLLILTTHSVCQGQFLDTFEADDIEGWFFFTGDGNTTMDFVQKDNFAKIQVDATDDRHNVWWAIIKQDISSSLDLSKLEDPDYELRVEARVRVSDAPRRLNFMINTQRTTDFHKQLKEFDIPDTTGWHTISMTTTDLDAVPGDSLFVQLGVTDWGHDTYHVDLDYYRADIINIHEAGPDKGEPLTYHPTVPDVDTFSHHLDVTHDGLINHDFPDVNFYNWSVQDENGVARILTINPNQWAVLRWDFDGLDIRKTDMAGLLELTTHSVPNGGDYEESFGEDLGMEFGKVRVIEITGGDPEWNSKSLTFNGLIRGEALDEVFNPQMIIDLEPSDEKGGKTYFTISRPVMQRMLDGRTKGLLIRPLGAINPSFYGSGNQSDHGPKLHLNSTE